MSIFLRTILAAVAILLLFTIPALGQTGVNQGYPEDTSDEDVDIEAEEGVEDEEAEEEEEAPEFGELIEELEVIEGLFTFYRDEEEGTVYMGIKPGQLDVIYLLSPTMESGTGERGIRGTMTMSERPIVFHREPGIIQVMEINTRFRADDDRVAKMLERMYSDSVLTKVDIEAEDEESGMILIDLGSVFLQDFLGLARRVDYELDEENSRIGTLKAFPNNVNISAIIVYTNKEPPSSVTLPDARSLRIEIRYDISERPDTGYMPRYADPRVGYFTSTFMDFTDDRDPERYKYFATRWHLEKKYPDREVSPPKEPIVFWLENTIPEHYLPAVRDGILMWNDAFERIGIKDAMEVKIMPDDADWDPADIRYNTIRWFSSYRSVFAIGPSRIDPFTGQIYDADIGVSIDFPYGYYYDYIEKIGLLGNNEPVIPDDPSFDPRWECHYGEGLMLNNFYARNVLRARGMIKPGSKDADEFAYAGLKALICHEVGHTLGLRHNYKATRGIPTEKLHDVSFTSVHGISSSIMDYDVVNIAPPGVEQGEYFSSTVGDYDRWAIEYGYSILGADSPEEEIPALEEIASRGAERFHIYGTDEDAHTGVFSLDPEAVSWDMGDDPFEYYEGTLKTSKELWDKLEDYWDKPGTDYKWFRATFISAFNQYWSAGRTIKRYVGGMVHNRYRVGDPNSESPYVPVPGDVQRKAIKFINKYIWSPDAFDFDPELLNKLGKPRQYGFDYSVNLSPHDFPIHAQVLSIQGQPLTWFYDPVVLTRILDMEYKYRDGVEPFYLSDMFVIVRDAIWEEVEKGRNVNSFRRNLQRYHLDILIDLIINPPDGSPMDAKALARMDLIHLADAIEEALDSRSLDYITRAHLSDVEAQINAALEAEFGF